RLTSPRPRPTLFPYTTLFRSKTERAHAWFTAAWLARYDGMELMGTEGAPDAYAESGEFEMPDLAKERRSGAYQTIAYDKEGNASDRKSTRLNSSHDQISYAVF